MGLFSVLDIILNKPMEEALQMVNVSKEISDAILNEKGEFYRILYLIKVYESGNFNEIDRLEIVDKINSDRIYEAYKESLKWYRDLFY